MNFMPQMDRQALVWLVMLVLLLLIEGITMGLTTIWFAGGALAAFGLAIIGYGTLVQIIGFCIVSGILLVFTRPAALRWVNKDRMPTNVNRLIGETAIVTEAISNLSGKGQVQIQGQYWTARSTEDEAEIAIGTKVLIKEISGVKLIVEKEETLNV